MLLLEVLDSTDNEVVKTIANNCSSYFNEIGKDLNNQLFRGVYTSAVNNMVGDYAIILKNKRENRNPKDTDLYFHKEANKYFVNKFGVPFRDSFFAIGNSTTASFYGMPCLFLPIGDFSFCWSEKISDFTALSFYISNLGDNGDVKFNMYMEQARYRTTDLVSAIKSNKEVMVYCKSAYLIMDTNDETGEKPNFDDFNKRIKSFL